MAKLLETPPLINITPLTEILEVPIHINNPIHPTSANKHKRLGFKILNELSRIEMFVTRIETVGKRYMNQKGLAEMFPKASEHLGIDPVIPGGSFMEAHLRQMSSINQLVSIAIQLQNDLRLTNHKFIAHQIALLYAGAKYTGFKARVEEHFSTVKDLCNASDEPFLTPELQSWLSELAVDIVAEALFSGRPMAQQTPSAGPLSEYINRVSKNDGDDEDHNRQ
ncbi:hypothetical protein BGX23_001774 [Mortierella sp. AD031]|nr:hypothetical protein BGX23_001774 [Mortierella sp. AD031]